MGRQFTVQVNDLQKEVTKVADFTSLVQNSSTARALEFWVIVTTIAGGTDPVDFSFETSIDGTNFKEQDKISGVAAAGTFTLALNRADHALGIEVRVKAIIAGATPSITYKVLMGRME